MRRPLPYCRGARVAVAAGAVILQPPQSGQARAFARRQGAAGGPR